jgi:hypothetical protein
LIFWYSVSGLLGLTLIFFPLLRTSLFSGWWLIYSRNHTGLLLRSQNKGKSLVRVGCWISLGRWGWEWKWIMAVFKTRFN